MYKPDNTKRTARLFGGLVFIFAVICPRPAAGVDLSLGLGLWPASGDFAMTGGPPDAANSWNLTHPVDSDMLILSASMGPLSGLSLDLSYGFGDIKNNTITDTDFDSTGSITDLSYSTSSGETELFTLDIRARLIGKGSVLTGLGWGHGRGRISGGRGAKAGKATGVRQRDMHRQGPSDKGREPQGSGNYLDLVLGYFRLENSAQYRDPTIVVNNYAPASISWEELWLEYDLEFSGLRLGLTGQLSMLEFLSIGLSAVYLPSVDADYEGLRYPERSAGLQQREKINADGDGVDLEAALSLRSMDRLLVETGYRYLDIETKGEDAEGTAWAGSSEELDLDFKGPFLRVMYTF